MTAAQKRLVNFIEQNNGFAIALPFKGIRNIATYGTIKAALKNKLIVSAISLDSRGRGIEFYALADKPLPEGYVRG